MYFSLFLSCHSPCLYETYYACVVFFSISVLDDKVVCTNRSSSLPQKTQLLKCLVSSPTCDFMTSHCHILTKKICLADNLAFRFDLAQLLCCCYRCWLWRVRADQSEPTGYFGGGGALKRQEPKQRLLYRGEEA